MSNEIVIELPYPPSVNHYWRHTKQGKHYISDEGKRYRSQSFLACLGYKPLSGQVSIHVDVYPPDNRKRDLDNLWKVILDSLAHAQIIEDDCWQVVPKQSIEAVEVIKGGKIIITIKALEAGL